MPGYNYQFIEKTAVRNSWFTESLVNLSEFNFLINDSCSSVCTLM